MLVAVPASKSSCDAVLASEGRPELSRQLSVETESGQARVCLISDVIPGLTHLAASGVGDDKLKITTDVRFETEGRETVDRR